MQLRHNVLVFAIFAIAVIGHSGSALAGPDDASFDSFDRLTCEPPLQTCEFLDSLFDNERAHLGTPADTCPRQYSCQCVPSCPSCRDCAAQICLRDPSRECTTACDCSPGLGCFGGRCIAGFAPVFCCDPEFFPIGPPQDTCPAGQQCQHRDGSFDTCPDDDPDDQMCRERVEKVTRSISRVVKRLSHCRRSEDCTHIDTSTECLGTCGEFVNADRARLAKRIINQLDRKICSDFNEKGCGTAIPICVHETPVCIRNRCVGVAGPIRDDARKGPVRDDRMSDKRL